MPVNQDDFATSEVAPRCSHEGDTGRNLRRRTLQEDKMESVVWAGMFLLLTIIGAPIGFAGMLGMPISADVQACIIGMGFLVAASGIGLLLFAPAPVLEPIPLPVTPSA
jgi:hypothetical protein